MLVRLGSRTGLRRGEKMFEELSYSYKLNKLNTQGLCQLLTGFREELTLLLDATVDAMALIITKSFSASSGKFAKVLPPRRRPVMFFQQSQKT